MADNAAEETAGADLRALGGLTITTNGYGEYVSLSFDLSTRDGKLIHAGRLSLHVDEYRSTLGPILRTAGRKDPRIRFTDDARPSNK